MELEKVSILFANYLALQIPRGEKSESGNVPAPFKSFCLTTFFSFSFFHLPVYFEEFESQRRRRKKVPLEQTVKERNRLLYSFKQQSQKFLLSSDSQLVFFFTFLLLFRNIVPQLCSQSWIGQIIFKPEPVWDITDELKTFRAP